MISGSFVYIVSNKSHRLYVGATTDLVRRVREHKEKLYPNGFTARYNFDRLVYYESARDFDEALRRERALKRMLRQQKVALIQADNPNWLDLSASWTDLLMVN